MTIGHGVLAKDKADKRRSYKRPAIRLVLYDADDDQLQGVIETSGTTGPGVNPVNPDDPDAGLANGSVWASPSDGQVP